jgi:L-cysteine desulfidase
MDIAKTITGLVMLGIFIVPVIILSVYNKKKNKTLLTKLKDFAAEKNCEISDFDINTQFAIGISTPGKQVFFIRIQEANQDLFKSSISLTQLKNCSLQTQSRSIKSQKSTEKVMDKLEIIFQSQSRESNNLCWLLYDAEITILPDNEYQVGKKWVSIINQAV